MKGRMYDATMKSEQLLYVDNGL